jgi:hypothetical protein
MQVTDKYNQPLKTFEVVLDNVHWRDLENTTMKVREFS